MEAIVDDAQQLATDPVHRKLLSRGRIFIDLEGLDIACVGVSVPIKNDTNRIHISFTKEWFDSHTNDEISKAVLEDLAMALEDPAAW